MTIAPLVFVLSLVLALSPQHYRKPSLSLSYLLKPLLHSQKQWRCFILVLPVPHRQPKITAVGTSDLGYVICHLCDLHMNYALLSLSPKLTSSMWSPGAVELAGSISWPHAI